MCSRRVVWVRGVTNWCPRVAPAGAGNTREHNVNVPPLSVHRWHAVDVYVLAWSDTPSILLLIIAPSVVVHVLMSLRSAHLLVAIYYTVVYCY